MALDSMPATLQFSSQRPAPDLPVQDCLDFLASNHRFYPLDGSIAFPPRLFPRMKQVEQGEPFLHGRAIQYG